MKNILVLSSDLDFKNSLSKKIRPYYEELSRIGIGKNIQLHRTSVYEFNIEKSIFNTVEKFNWEHWVEENNFSPDLIWYKSNNVNYLSRIIEEKFNFINNTKFIELANNKLITSIVFTKESPKTHLLNDESLSFFKDDEEVIIKPDWGSAGEGVEKLKIRELRTRNLNSYQQYIIQELIDSSEWIEWIVDWIHDIRFFIYWNEIWDTVLLRTPPKWDFRCNVSQWGDSRNISISEFPKELINTVSWIQKKLQDNFWIIYWSIDFTKSRGKYYLIEFNSSPWVIMHPLYSKESDEYHEEIIDFFTSLLN